MGDNVIDLHPIAEAGLFDDLEFDNPDNDDDDDDCGFHPRIAFSMDNLDHFMKCDRRVWIAVRNRIIALFSLDDDVDDDDDDDAATIATSANDTTPTASAIATTTTNKNPTETKNTTANSNNDNINIIRPDYRLRDNMPLRNSCIHPMSNVRHHLPCAIGDYTDFYSSREHATNVGTMFRGRENALQDNWLHVPIGYHGRSSSVYVSEYCTSSSNVRDDSMMCGGIRRPCGQVMLDPSNPRAGSVYRPTTSLDFELEVAFFVGGKTNVDDDFATTTNTNTIGRPMTSEEARDRIFGYVLMNDWSARDVQRWEYVPLGPFTSKNFATTISPWIITCMALEPYRCETSAVEQGGKRRRRMGGEGEDDDGDEEGGGSSFEEDEPTPLDYLVDPHYGELIRLFICSLIFVPLYIYISILITRYLPSFGATLSGSYDVNLSVSIRPSSTSASTVVCRSNLRNMYWSSVQQLVHHSVTGCPIRAGDLLASGTISGSERGSHGSMLELSWGGTRDVELDGGVRRRFLEDGDAVIMEGWCEGRPPGGRVGFGACSARILPAVPFPYDSPQGGLAKEGGRSRTLRYTQFRLRVAPPTSSFAWKARIALAAKGVQYETIVSNSSPEDECPADDGNCGVSAEKTKDTPKQVMAPTLEFVDGMNGIARISRSNAMIDFLESAFPDQGGRLLPPDPVARARSRDVAEAIDSIMPYSAEHVDEVVGKNIVDGLSRLESLLTAYHPPLLAGAAGGPFSVGTHGPNIADISLIPLMHNARRYGIDSSLYPMLTSIEMACKDHPWFRAAAPKMCSIK